MQSVAAFFLCLAVHSHIPAAAVPVFNINLDLPPEQRWVEVANHYREEIKALAVALWDAIQTQLGAGGEQEFLALPFDQVAEAELRGIADEINSPALTVDLLRLTNMLYELASPTACSGVLWAKVDGTVLHGRNMDYSFSFQMPDGRTLNWPDVTFEAVFHSGGRPFMKTTQWPGSIGVHTGMRYDGWSFEQNTRTPNDWRENLEAGKSGGQPFAWAARKIMEEADDYETAMTMIYSTKFMAPQYFVIAGRGPFEGSVLTIDRLGQLEADTPPIQYLSDWYLVQTNDDLLAEAKDDRRPLANEVLLASDQQVISEEHLMNFMHAAPLFVEHTVFTTVMVPSTGYYKTVLPNEAPYPAEADAMGLSSTSLVQTIGLLQGRPEMHWRYDPRLGALVQTRSKERQPGFLSRHRSFGYTYDAGVVA